MKHFGLLLALWGLAGPALAGPVFTLLDGPRYCPRDRALDARKVSGDEAIARARAWLPDGYCAPARDRDGCDADVERIHDTFRVFFHQYKLREGRRDWTRLDHTYVVLDATGNCLAHIPGTGPQERAH